MCLSWNFSPVWRDGCRAVGWWWNAVVLNSPSPVFRFHHPPSSSGRPGSVTIPSAGYYSPAFSHLFRPLNQGLPGCSSRWRGFFSYLRRRYSRYRRHARRERTAFPAGPDDPTSWRGMSLVSAVAIRRLVLAQQPGVLNCGGGRGWRDGGGWSTCKILAARRR